MKLSAPLTVLALLLMCLAGCSSMGSRGDPPELDVVGVAMTSSDVFSQSFLVKLHFRNPNAHEMQIKTIQYQLFLEGDFFAEGTHSQPIVVPASGETDFNMRVRTSFTSGVARLLTRLNGRTTVEYIMEGTLQTDSGKFPYQKSGNADLATVR